MKGGRNGHARQCRRLYRRLAYATIVLASCSNSSWLNASTGTRASTPVGTGGFSEFARPFLVFTPSPTRRHRQRASAALLQSIVGGAQPTAAAAQSPTEPTAVTDDSAPANNLPQLDAAEAVGAVASMDPLAELLSERPAQQLSTSELNSRIALLEDATTACRAELESRTTGLAALPDENQQLTASLVTLPDEMQQLLFGQLRNVLDPRDAVNYSSASKGLREPMQRVGEGASKSPLEQLKEENAAAAALGLSLGVRSCKALREAKELCVAPHPQPTWRRWAS